MIRLFPSAVEQHRGTIMSNSLIDSAYTPIPDVFVSEHARGTTLVLEVSGSVDMVTAPKLHIAVQSALAGGPKKLIIDLSGVDFLAAAGLHVLDVARACAGQTVVAVVADGPATSRPIEITGLNGLVELYPTVDDVLDQHAA